jgi:hypothetical protein
MMKSYLKKVFLTLIGVTSSVSFLLANFHRIPPPIKAIRRPEITEDNILYLEHAKAIDSEIEWGQLQHTSHRSHRSHSSHRSHRSSSTSSYRYRAKAPLIPKNNKPVTKDQKVMVNENTMEIIHLEVKDVDGDKLNNIVVHNPKHGKVIINGNDANFTPEKDYSGSDSFQYKSSDGKSYSNVATVQITIIPEVTALMAESQTISAYQNSPTQISLSKKVSENNSLKYLLLNTPKNGKISGSGSVFIYTPDKNYIGVDNFKFVVSDGEKISQPATITIFVIKRK